MNGPDETSGGEWTSEIRELEMTLASENSGLRDKIVRNLGDYTVALLGITNAPEHLELAGTGTLITVNGAHYIQTARHVWDEVLVNVDVVGITLRPNVNHRYGIWRKEFTVVGLPKPTEWNEWGLDLVLLRIPAEHIGSILAYKVFLNIDKPARQLGPVLWTQVLMGTPSELGSIRDTHADLQITGFFLSAEQKCERDGFDYLDYDFDLTFPGMPRRFGGVSGGGIWNVYSRRSSETGKIDWDVSLHGVAFFQLDVANEHRTIRCHGPESMNALLRMLRSSAEGDAYPQVIL